MAREPPVMAYRLATALCSFAVEHSLDRKSAWAGDREDQHTHCNSHTPRVETVHSWLPVVELLPLPTK